MAAILSGGGGGGEGGELNCVNMSKKLNNISFSNLKKTLLKPNLSLSETKVLTCRPWLVLAFHINPGRGNGAYIVWVNDLIMTNYHCEVYDECK